MGALAYEVVWPLHRRHYLNHELNSEELIIVNTSVSPDDASAPGRDLAARALLAAACTQERAGTLLGVSRRTIGRTADLDVTGTVRDADALTLARTCLADSASRGVTLRKERLLVQDHRWRIAVDRHRRRLARDHDDRDWRGTSSGRR